MHYLVPSAVSYEVGSSITPTYQTGSGIKVPHTQSQSWEVEESAVKPGLCDSRVRDLKHRLRGRGPSRVSRVIDTQAVAFARI